MTFITIATLFATMAILGAIPSTSVFIVVSRSIASGFIHGFATATGIVIGDIIFILIAIYGLAIIADTMGNLFILVKYIASAYLIWLGIGLLKLKPDNAKIDKIQESSLLSSFLCGLFITLGDQKAILFYIGFFPAFLDLSNISIFDISIIIAITIIAVGGTKLIYAYMADRTKLIFKNFSGIMNKFAGWAMIATGIFLVANSHYLLILRLIS